MIKNIFTYVHPNLLQTHQVLIVLIDSHAFHVHQGTIEPSSDTTDQYITTHTCSEYKTLILLFTLVIRDNSGLPSKTYQRAFYVFKINYITDRTRNTNTAIFLNVPYGLSTNEVQSFMGDNILR